jgi:hypothetical protein
MARQSYVLSALLALLVSTLLGPAISSLSSLTPITQAAPAQTASLDDPRLAAGTYLGGGGVDYGRAVGLDAQGNIYLAGDSFSSSILGQELSDNGGTDIVVAKLSPDAKHLLGMFSLGSATSDRVGGMAVTPAGEVVLTIETADPNFPLKNAQNTTVLEDNPGVLLKINAALNDLVFSTFTTFTVEYEKHNVAIDGAGNISVVGYLYDPFSRDRDLVLQKYTPDGQQQLLEKIWDGDARDEIAAGLVVRPDGSTTIAGSTEGRINDLAVTPNAVQSICGRKLMLGDEHDCDKDAFVFTLNPAGQVTYATYLGGSGSDSAVGLAVDGEGGIYLAGDTSATDFPTTPGAFQPECLLAKPEDLCYYDAFVAKIAPDGSTLAYSTYLASVELGGLDYPVGIAVDSAGNATFVGFTASERWPTTSAVQGALNAAPCPNAFQDRLCFDSVVATFGPDGQPIFISYLGGTFDETTTDVAVGPDGSIYLTGYSESADYPVSADSVQPIARSGIDFFLAHIDLHAASTPGAGSYHAYLPDVKR